MCLRVFFPGIPLGFPPGGAVLDTYRAFILDDQDRITGAEVFSAASDEAAIVAARSFREAAEIEIWCGRRLVARVAKGGEPEPPTGS